MNCGSKSGGHTYFPHRRIHIEIFHYVSRFPTKFLSHVPTLRRYSRWILSFPSRALQVSPRTRWTFMKIQKILVCFCCRESPRTLVPFCIFLPHLRTRRCVILIWVSRYGFRRTLLKNQTFLTRCSVFHRMAGCIWTQHSRRTCFSLRNSVWRRLRHCHNYLFSVSLFHPLVLKFWAANWAEKADVKQMEKIVPLIMSTYLIWTLGSRLILSHNHSGATLWVLDTCLIVGLLPSMIILITASLSSKM